MKYFYCDFQHIIFFKIQMSDHELTATRTYFVRASELATLAGISRFASKTTLANEIVHIRKPPKILHAIDVGRPAHCTPLTATPITRTFKSKSAASPEFVQPVSVAYNEAFHRADTNQVFHHGLFALQKNTPTRKARNIQGDYANAIGVADELQATIRVWRRLKEQQRTEETMHHLAEAVLNKYRTKHQQHECFHEYLPVHPDMVRRLVLCCLRKVSGNDHEPEAIARFCKASKAQVTRQQEEINFRLSQVSQTYGFIVVVSGRVDGVVTSKSSNTSEYIDHQHNYTPAPACVRPLVDTDGTVNSCPSCPGCTGYSKCSSISDSTSTSVLEVKTYTRRGTTPHRAPKEHVIQVHAYMHALGLNSAVILYSSPRTQSIVRVAWDQGLWDDVCYRSMASLEEARLRSLKIK